MLGMLTSSMQEVKMRFKKPAIVAAIVLVVVIGVVISQGNLGKLLSGELLQVLMFYFIVGGLWYGRYIVFFGAQAPIDENTGEPYYPGGFTGSMWRWAMALAIGATVGAVFFAIDAVRIIIDYVKNIIKK